MDFKVTLPRISEDKDSEPDDNLVKLNVNIRKKSKQKAAPNLLQNNRQILIVNSDTQNSASCSPTSKAQNNDEIIIKDDWEDSVSPSRNFERTKTSLQSKNKDSYKSKKNKRVKFKRKSKFQFKTYDQLRRYFVLQLKQIGIDFRNFNGEGMNHMHVRELLNNFGYQITGVKAIEALLQCKEYKKQDHRNIFDTSRTSKDSASNLDDIIRAPVNLDIFINWVLSNESHFGIYDAKNKQEDHPCLRLYNKTILNKQLSVELVRSNKASFGRNTSLARPIIGINKSTEINLAQTLREDKSEGTRLTAPRFTVKSVTKMMNEPQFKFKKKIMTILKDIHRYPKMKKFIREKIGHWYESF